MDLKETEKFLNTCSAEELCTVQEIISKQLQKIDKDLSKIDDESARKLRCEKRYDVDFIGTLTRITDVKPKERKDYSVTIKNMSRSGMCLWVDTNFTHSRIIQVTFNAPGGKIKQCLLEIIRMHRKSTKDGAWLELGCQSVSREEVRRLRMQEEQANRACSKLRSGGKVNILVVGPQDDSFNRIFSAQNVIKRYSVKFADSLAQAVNPIKNAEAQLVIFRLEDELYTKPHFTVCIQTKPASLATLAIIEKEDKRPTLLQAGVDECLSVNNCEEFLLRAIERTLASHAVRGIVKTTLSGRVLIVSVQNARLNLLSHHLEENDYNVRLAHGLEEANHCMTEPFDAVFVDYNASHPEEMAHLQMQFSGLPIIALCDDYHAGRQAVMNGASNYLCMPLDKEDIQMIVKQLMSAELAPTT